MRERSSPAASTRCVLRTRKSPPSASSTNSSGSMASAMPSSTGSSPGGVIKIVLPTANGPRSSIRSTPAFHSGQRSTSAQSRQTAGALAVVSTLCSTAHMKRTLVRRRPLPTRPRGGRSNGRCSSTSSRVSAGAAELRLDRLVCARGGAELREGELENVVALFWAAVAAVGDAEVGHDLGLVLLIAELAERRCRLLEEPDRPVVVASVAQGEREIGLRQSAAAPVA